ncbi:MAG: ABC transporter ATP-binding protein [Acidobacteriota bacterium]|jgi:ABC-type multidrug transport system ATPase subunit
MDIRISSLTKIYDKAARPALDGIDLQISTGTFGLLGPNGAGKTTLIKILSTQMKQTSGEVTIDGMRIDADRDQVRRRLGYLPQHFGAYPDLTAFEFLDYMARLAHIRPGKYRKQVVEEALEAVALTEVRDKHTGAFSGGMKRRLGIAQAILAEPDFLIVDEPTVGLDPEERIRFRKILGRLSRDRAILISTHIVGDISSTCEDIAVLNFGRLLFHGGPEELVRHAENKTWTLHVDDAGFAQVQKEWHVVTVTPMGDDLMVRIVGDQEPPSGAEPEPPNLEDAYIYFMAMDGHSPDGVGE